jgi:hypothetical protein
MILENIYLKETKMNQLIPICNFVLPQDLLPLYESISNESEEVVCDEDKSTDQSERRLEILEETRNAMMALLSEF